MSTYVFKAMDLAGVKARGEIDAEQFRGWLNAALARAEDRALFGLPATKPLRQP